MARALGLQPRGGVLTRFISNRVLADIVGAELRDKIENPLKFQWGSGGAGMPPSTIYGFDSGVMIDMCNAIIAAEDALGPRYTNIVRQAHLIVGASARLGIRNLVYALAGYTPTSATYDLNAAMTSSVGSQKI